MKIQPHAPGVGCRIAMAKFEADLRAASTQDKVFAWIRAGALSLPANRIGDVIANTLMGVGEFARLPVASVLDRSAARVTARGLSKARKKAVDPLQMRVRMFNPLDAFTGAPDAYESAVADVWQIITKGTSNVDANRAQMRGEVLYETPILGPAASIFVNGVMRLVQSSDRPFYWMAYHRSAREIARLRGVQAGLSGADLDGYITRTLPFLDPDDYAMAAHDALAAVLQDETTVFKGLQGLKNGMASPLKGVSDLPNTAGKGVGDLFFLFTKTPSNAAQRAAEYSGAGLLMGARNLRQAYRAATNGDISNTAKLQRYAVDQMSRGTVGLAALAAGAWLYEQGNLSLGYPSDEAERGRMEVLGKKENSIRIGDRWYGLARLGPIGPVVVVGGYMAAAKKGEQGFGAIARGGVGLVAGLAQTGADQPAFSGMESLVGIADSQRGAANLGDWASRTVGGFLVPGLVTKWTQYADPVVRERYVTELFGVDVPEALRKPVGGIVARVPGMSDDLPARHDVLGDEVPREGSLLRLGLDAFNSQLDRSNQDAVRREIERTGVGIPRITTKEAGETQAGFYLRREQYGIAVRGVLSELIQSDEYRGIEEGMRWAARTVPGYDARRLNHEIRTAQAAILKDAVEQTRKFYTRERKAGRFKDTGGFPLPGQQTEEFVEDATGRALDRVAEQAEEIGTEEGM